MTTHGFQKGTLTFARSKGIALALFEPDPIKLEILVLSENADDFLRQECLKYGLDIALTNAFGQISLTEPNNENAG